MISVIVPVYNVENYVGDCINSLIQQTYNDIEIIVVNDGSTDKSLENCELFARKDERIKIYSKENGGLSDARNYGISKSSGEFLLFVDSDDVVNKNFISTLINEQKRTNAEIVAVGIKEFNEINEIDINEKIECPKSYLFDRDHSLKEYFEKDGVAKVYHGVCMKMFDSKLFKNIVFEKGRLHEDLFITYKLLDKCEIFVYVDCNYYYYRKNFGSISRNYRIKNLIDEYDAIEEMSSYFKNDQRINLIANGFCVRHLCRMLVDSYGINYCNELAIYRKLIKNKIKSICKSNKQLTFLRLIKIFIYIHFPNVIFEYINLVKARR